MPNILNMLFYDEGITTLKDFYTKHIEDNTYYTNCDNNGKDCSSSLKDEIGYKKFKKFIKANEHFTNMNMHTMAMLYDAFKILCKMYTEFDEKTSDCEKYLKYSSEFFNKYEILNNIDDITEGSPYRQVLSTLLNDYDNFKNKYNEAQCCKSSPLQTIEKMQASARSSEFTLSNLSIEKKLSIVLSIFGAIVLFLGISYKVNNKKLKKKLLYICKH
ncbi:hypothetical protein YYC_04876 [Plasmodium yoelii 17X]|uniref:Uncharacterized protein n=1 Tax=Plasmodium yoelii 17X TaxID=1323249 RepID=V7PC71_PLAYE|nr:hypothetical protein YYC_04876 [Plasmodium yoelii 17X]